MNNKLTAIAVGLAVVCWPAISFACAVCFDANEETRGAFLGTTIFLSLLPLGVVGGLIYFLFRRARMLAAEDAEPTA